MKKYIYTVFLLIYLFFSCELNTEVYDKINPDIFPKNASDVEALISGNVYYPFSSWIVFNVAMGYQLITDMVTDMADCSWEWDIAYNTHEAGSWLLHASDRPSMYSRIHFLSRMILTIDRIKDVEMNDELKKRFIAEAQCGMGFLSFLLYDMYGPIPLPDIETLKDPLGDKILPRSTDAEMRDFIETNLLQASEILPYQYDNSEYGRFTKGLANTLLMKFYMLIGEFEKAEKMGRELLKPEYGYNLVDDYYYLFSLAGEKNTEVIYSAICKAGFMQQQWIAHVLPSDYPTPAGQTITKWDGYKMTWPFYETFDKKDKRLARIVAEYTGTGGVKHSKLLDRDSGTKGVLYKGAIPIKYGFETVIGQHSEIDIVVYRYADVLTLLSEVIVRNKGSVTQEAVNLMNTIRTRAGLHVYKLSDFADVQDFMDKILLERGHEFYFEGVRRQDLIRHRKFIPNAIEKNKYAGQSTAKVETQVNGVYKYEKFPLPNYAINEGKGVIEQNPGF